MVVLSYVGLKKGWGGGGRGREKGVYFVLICLKVSTKHIHTKRTYDREIKCTRAMMSQMDGNNGNWKLNSPYVWCGKAML